MVERSERQRQLAEALKGVAKQKEIPPERVSREAWMSTAEGLIQGLSAGILETQLELMQLRQCVANAIDSEELGLRVSYWQKDGHLMFQVDEKGEMGFLHREVKRE